MDQDKIYTAIDLFTQNGVRRAQLRVVAVPFNNVVKVHIREFYGPDFSPGRGAAIALDQLDDVINALQLAAADRAAGVFDDDA